MSDFSKVGAGKASRKERRSSILKVTSSREPLQDVGNSPGLEDNPTMTFTNTNLNKGAKKRRSSIGRRVSFSTATKVKEFATGDKDYTLWNSTYEEERKNVTSESESSSHKSSDSEVFLAEKTFVMNEEMEMTDVLPASVQQHLSGGRANDLTVVGAEEMEVTMAVNKSMGNLGKASVNDQITMDITALVQPDQQEQCHADDMEMTAAVTSAMAKDIGQNPSEEEEKKPSGSSVTNFLAQLKSSSSSTVQDDEDMEMTVPKIPSTEEPQSSDEMEMTTAVKSSMMNSLITTGGNLKHDMFKPSEKVPVSTDDMEMTTAVTSAMVGKIKQSEQKIEEKKELEDMVHNQIKLDNSNLAKASVNDQITMDITALVQPVQQKQRHALMEMIAAVTSAMAKDIGQKPNEEEDKNPSGSSMTNFLGQLKSSSTAQEDEDMEMTVSKIPSTGGNFEAGIQRVEEPQSSDEMEMTTAVKSSMMNSLINQSPEKPLQVQDDVDHLEDGKTTVDSSLTPQEISLDLEAENLLEKEQKKSPKSAQKIEEMKDLEDKVDNQIKLDNSNVGRDESMDDNLELSSILGDTTSPPAEMSFDLKEAENRFNEEQKVWDVKLTNLRSHIDSMKRFLVDLDNEEESSTDKDTAPAPVKKPKLVPTVFETLVPVKEKVHHGHWMIIDTVDEKEAKFSFFQQSMELTLVLGHPSIKKDIKHWAIRKAAIEFVQSGDLSIKLMQHLFLKEWTPEKLSKLFESTDHLGKSLDRFGQSVNDAVRFVLNLEEIKGTHCVFKIQNCFQVYIEFFSRSLRMAFGLHIDFSQGFRVAKDQGTKLQPLVSHAGYKISPKAFNNIRQNSPSGWNYITHLTTMLDKYIVEMEKGQM